MVNRTSHRPVLRRSETLGHWIALNRTNVQETIRAKRGTLNRGNFLTTLCYDTANDLNVLVAQQHSSLVFTIFDGGIATQGCTKIRPLWLLLLPAAILIYHIETRKFVLRILTKYVEIKRCLRKTTLAIDWADLSNILRNFPFALTIDK